SGGHAGPPDGLHASDAQRFGQVQDTYTLHAGEQIVEIHFIAGSSLRVDRAEHAKHECGQADGDARGESRATVELDHSVGVHAFLPTRNPVGWLPTGSKSRTRTESVRIAGRRCFLSAHPALRYPKLTTATLRDLAKLRRWSLILSISCSV